MIDDDYKTDLNGKKYLTVEQVKKGLHIECDDGFDCIKKNSVKIIESDENGELYVPCKAGRHYLDGQLEQDIFIGFYPLQS